MNSLPNNCGSVTVAVQPQLQVNLRIGDGKAGGGRAPPASKLVLDLPTPEGCKAELTYAARQSVPD